ncbi:MAG: YjbQ family protein [Acidobacteria bacterium]|nr:YjbQ family protein [Acidobacteriota bacterium]
MTKQIAMIVARSGIRHGMVNVQTRHTTTSIIVNEHEPLLLEDLEHLLEKLAPRSGDYQHNDFSRRVDIPPDEPANGHSPASRSSCRHPSISISLMDRCSSEAGRASSSSNLTMPGRGIFP